MDIQLINAPLLKDLYKQAEESIRLRQHFDLRTTPADGSQRMLNALQPGTKVPIHRHMDTSETAVCLEGKIDWVFYEELPNVDEGGSVHDGETVFDESCFKEIARFRVCPKDRLYGIQVPQMVWHTIEVYEPSVIFEAKDGAYIG